MVRAKEMHQFGIISVDQDIYFLNVEISQMIHKLINRPPIPLC